MEAVVRWSRYVGISEDWLVGVGSLYGCDYPKEESTLRDFRESDAPEVLRTPKVPYTSDT